MSLRSNTHRLGAVLLVIVLLAASVSVVTSVAAGGTSQASGQPTSDTTVTRIDVHENGTAVWELQIRTHLANDSEEAQYREFQSSFRNNTDSYVSSFANRMKGVVSTAENYTGREMNASNFTGSTTVQEYPQRWGVVTFTFTWDGFAAVDDSQALHMGDVFGSDGYYLGDGDTLIVSLPEGYDLQTAEPSPETRDGQTLKWRGPTEFGDDRPSIIAAPPSDVPASETPSVETPASDDSFSGISVIGALILLGIVGATLILAVHRDSGSSPGDGASLEGDSLGNDSPPSDLVSDEERVITLVESNGGRMRQANLAEELDWSDSKASRTLSSMTDEGEIEKLRLGRENIISLPDVDVDASEDGDFGEAAGE